MTVIKVLISYILMVDICNENEHIYEKYKSKKRNIWELPNVFDILTGKLYVILKCT